MAVAFGALFSNIAARRQADASYPMEVTALIAIADDLDTAARELGRGVELIRAGSVQINHRSTPSR